MADFTYEILPEKRAIVIRFRGHFTRAALASAVERLWSDPRYRTDYVGIVDLSDTTVGMAMEDFRHIVEWVRGQDRTSVNRWAAVASTPLATACALLYRRAMADRQRFEVFSTWEAACRYIEVDLPPPEVAAVPMV